MNTMKNEIKSTAAYATGAVYTGSTFNMANYCNALIQLHAFKVDPDTDTAVAANVTLTVYKCETSSNTSSSEVFSTTVLALPSGTNESLATVEIRDSQLAKDKPYFFATVAAAATVTVSSSLVVHQGHGNYDPQD